MVRNYSEYYVLLFFEILFLGLGFQAVLIQDTTRFYAVIAAMGIALIPVVVEWALSVRLTAGVKSVVALALLVHLAGGINRWYWKFAPYYDKLAHVIAALALGMAILSLFLILSTRGITFRPPWIIAWIITLVILFGALWEIGEYSIDLLVRSSYNNGVMDSILDTISNLIGLGIAVGYSWWIMKGIPNGETPGCLIRQK
jgi:hypothetical protein